MEKSISTGFGSLRNITALLLLVLLICLVFMFRLYNQNNELRQNNTDLLAKFSSSDSLLNQVIDEQKIISDTSTVVVNLQGTKAAPHGNNASVYWDSTLAAVYLVVKNMPQLPSGAQYQLWALIDGKPADLGVFDTPKDKVLLKMKETKKADAFAITIEKKGGSIAPTLEKMQSYGKKVL